MPVFSWINRIISRLGASPGSATKKPGLAPKRLIQSGAVQLKCSQIFNAVESDAMLVEIGDRFIER